ncbi:MAG: type II secretion system protein J [Cyanobium sp.]
MRFPSRHRPAAFTLVELLLGAAFGVILLAGLMMMATSLLRAGVRDDNQQSAQDAWARVNQFLNIEVGEAGRLYQGTTEVSPIVLDQAPSCSGANRDAGSGSFAIRVPNSDPAQNSAYATITYYMSGGHLMRCGPPVLANGSLNFSASSSEAILSYNTCLELDSTNSCRTVTKTSRCWDVADDSRLGLGHEGRSIAYRLHLSSAHSAEPELSCVGRAWAQSSIIELED